MKKTLLIIFLLFVCKINSQNIYFKYETNSTKQDTFIENIAKELLAKYNKGSLKINLDEVFRLQIINKQYNEAFISIDSIRNINRLSLGSYVDVIGIQYETLIKTKINNFKKNNHFKSEYNNVFNSIITKINDKNIDDVYNWFDYVFTKEDKNFNEELKLHINKDSISTNSAIKLCRLYLYRKMAKEVMPLALPLLKKIENSRYIINDTLLIKTSDNFLLAANLVIPKKYKKPLPVIFVYDIYANKEGDKTTAKKIAQNGYIGIVVNTRGKSRSPHDINPFENDAKDAYDVIDWISKQSWCNGEIGMYGGSYLGFSQWSAVKKLHPALKTIIPQVAVGTGIDYPMHNNIFQSYMLSWIHYVVNNKFTDDNDFDDDEKWNTTYKNWYKSGKSFRALDSIDGRPNKIFQRWLDHPNFDSYWQNMRANNQDFSKINIPVLSITGYFDDDQLGALHYFREHNKINPNNKHYLLIGPYDHPGAQGYPRAKVFGYKIDSVANIKIKPLLFKWFDYVLKDSVKPSLIKNKINYQVMGSNKWKHTSSIKKMNNDNLVFYLDNTISGKDYKLTTKKTNGKEYIKQEIDFKDRSDFNDYKEEAFIILDSTYVKHNGMTFISQKFNSDFEFNSSFSANLIFKTNKKDLDISIKLYEIDKNGNYFLLSDYLGRASHTKDKSIRNLLKPNKKVKIHIKKTDTYFTSKLIPKGSKIMLILSINKNPNWQINYGSGKDVSNETILDGKIPLKIKWYNNSNINIPIHRENKKN